MLYFSFLSYHIIPIRQGGNAEKAAAKGCRRWIFLLLPEGLAVGALVHGRILLMGTNQDLVQGAVVLALAVVCALLDSAFDGLVCVAVHVFSSFELTSGLVCAQITDSFRKIFPFDCICLLTVIY